jgi:hypothetical protein
MKRCRLTEEVGSAVRPAEGIAFSEDLYQNLLASISTDARLEK